VFSPTEKAEKAIYDQLMKIVEAAFDGIEIPEEEVRKIVDEILSQQATDGANAGAKAISGMAFGDDVTNAIKTQLENDGYHLSDDFNKKMDARTSYLINKLADESKSIAQSTLLRGEEEGLSANQIRQNLQSAMPRYRAELIARNETVNAFRAGRLENDQYLQNTYGLKLGMTWRCTHDSKTCPICEAMDGKTVAISQSFPTIDVEVENKDGRTKTLSWSHDIWNDECHLTNAHPNCRCYFDEVVLDE
jgi:hypothetical protein